MYDADTEEYLRQVERRYRSIAVTLTPFELQQPGPELQEEELFAPGTGLFVGFSPVTAAAGGGAGGGGAGAAGLPGSAAGALGSTAMLRVLELDKHAGGPTVVETTGPEARERVARPPAGRLRWIDITAQTPADIELLAQGFQFHPLTLEDCLHVDQRPKLEEYVGPQPYLFIVIHNFSTAEGDAAGEPETSLLSPAVTQVLDGRRFTVQPEEVHAFLGEGYLVTAHVHPVAALDTVWQRVRKDGALFGKGTDFLYYLVADAVCDSNFPVLERLGDLLDEIEEVVLSRPEKEHLHRIYQMRKVLVIMRRVLSPQRDILARLSRHGGNVCIQADTATYFRDIHDHLMRINEGIEAGRDLLGNCVDAYLSGVGQRTNEIMKQLTILSSFMLPLTFVSGFFGMNFEALPYKSTAVLVLILVLMFVLVPGGMLLWFRSRRWL